MIRSAIVLDSKCEEIVNSNNNFFFKLHLIQYLLLHFNHAPLCKVAYNWLSAALTIYHKYLTRKKRIVSERELV